MIFVYLYLIELLIRPQDWFGPLVGLPTHWLIIVPGLIYGFLSSSNSRDLIKTPESKLIAAYVLLVFIATFVNTGFAFAQYQFMKAVKIFSVFYMLFLLLDDERKIKNTLICLLILGVLLSEHAILQAVTGTGWAGVTLDPKYSEIRVRWLGVWDGSNGFCLLLGVILPVALEVVFNHPNIVVRLMGLCFFIMISTGIYFTNSRGSILAVLCGLFFYVFSRWNFKRGIIILLCSFLVLGAIMPERMTEINTQESSAHERSWAWEQGIRIFKDNPILGIGKGQYVMHTEDGILSHNNYVQIFSEMGSLGYFLFISFIWFPLKRSYAYQRKEIQEGKERFSLVRIINTSFVIFLSGTFFVVMENDLLAVLLALTSCMTWNLLKKDDQYEETVQMNDIIGIISVMAIFYSAIWLIAIKEII